MASCASAINVHAALAGSCADCLGAGADALTDPCEREPVLVQPDRFIRLLGAEPLVSHLDAMPFQDDAHRSPIDVELVTELIDRRSALVALDQFLNLPRIQPASGAWPTSRRPLQRGRSGPWQPLQQRPQCPDLHRFVVVGSPDLHFL